MNKRKYTLGEEIFNSTTHGIGAILSLIALILMLVFSSTGMEVASSIIFGTTLILLYTSSTLYHALTNEKAKKVFQILDHCTIYLLIAGTYTPYALLTIGGKSGWVIFIIIWLSALLGILLNSINLSKFRKISIALYVAMGWAIAFYIPQLLANLKFGGLLLLIIGGLLYTLGIVFYIIKNIKYFHSIWHLFVLFASICHILSVLIFVI
ncbi:MAG: hemolysin III family protein [Firmicutes bacterium]|nr:hemolysin III family protein [Bacillota bacterium]